MRLIFLVRVSTLLQILKYLLCYSTPKWKVLWDWLLEWQKMYLRLVYIGVFTSTKTLAFLATVSMFVVMDVYDSHGKQIHQPWDVAVWKIEKVLFFQNITPKVQA